MRMTTTKKFYVFLFLALLNLPLFSQIKIKELPREVLSRTDSLLYQISDYREITLLNNGWEVYLEDDTENRAQVSVPATFSGASQIIFEKKFNFDKKQFLSKKKEIVFLGVTYSCEVFLNDVSIHKHPGGEIPFSIELNDELLNDDNKNTLTVIVNAEYDAINTIPLKQKYLFPDIEGGIVGDVFLQTIPAISIGKVNSEAILNSARTQGDINLNFRIQTPDNDKIDFTGYALRVKLINRAGAEIVKFTMPQAQFVSSGAGVKVSISLDDPVLWSPANPHYYTYSLELTKQDSITDFYSARTGFYKLEKNENKLLLNGSEFSFYGTGYVPYDKTFKSMLAKSTLAEELRQIKMMGFNAVRFSKVIPNPFAIEYCSEIGLFTLIDLPLNSMPGKFASDKNFFDRAAGRLKTIIENFEDQTSVVAFGIGSSYIANSQEHTEFITSLASSAREVTKKNIYASFIGFPESLPAGLDFCGLESFAIPEEKLISEIDRLTSKNGLNNYLLSDIVYPTFNGGTDGYLNKFSKEAQAKYFADIIDYVKKSNLPGFFFTSYYDYAGTYSSLFAGYNSNRVYHVGILGEDKGQNSLSYKIIKSKLNNGEKVNIPLGSKRDDAPILFILTGLFLSIVLALLVNSKRKFREDVMRALFRPYNFYADIRDHRIISGFHSNVLFLTLAGAHSLLVTNLLYFLRHNFLLDKSLLAFSSEGLLDIFAYLAWNPIESLIYLFFGSVVFVLVLTFFFMLTTFFIRTKVMFSSIYYSAIWAFLPLSLLLPLELVLYRVLAAGVVNIYIYAVLGIFVIWLVQRLLKGIYVIFDVRASSVYLTTFLFLLLTIGGTYLYFHLTEETTFYLINAWKQYSVM